MRRVTLAASVAILLSSLSSGVEASCSRPFSVLSGVSSSCWDEANIEGNGDSYVYVSIETLNDIFIEITSPPMAMSIEDDIEPRAIADFVKMLTPGVTSENKGVAAFRLQDEKADGFEPEDCNIFSVVGDEYSTQMGTFVSPGALANAGKTCEGMKHFIASRVVTGASSEIGAGFMGYEGVAKMFAASEAANAIGVSSSIVHGTPTNSVSSWTVNQVDLSDAGISEISTTVEFYDFPAIAVDHATGEAAVVVWGGTELAEKFSKTWGIENPSTSAVVISPNEVANEVLVSEIKATISDGKQREQTETSFYYLDGSMIRTFPVEGGMYSLEGHLYMQQFSQLARLVQRYKIDPSNLP